jgi:hypothetical protein
MQSPVLEFRTYGYQRTVWLSRNLTVLIVMDAAYLMRSICQDWTFVEMSNCITSRKIGAFFAANAPPERLQTL